MNIEYIDLYSISGDKSCFSVVVFLFDFQKGTLRDIGQNEMSSKTVILPSFPIAKYKVWNWWSQFFLGTWDVDKDGMWWCFDLHPR